jgi:outer membrane translocation and assembly module TamA
VTLRRSVFVVAVAVLLALACGEASAQAVPPEVVAEVRIHGNYRTPDADVLQLAGITAGSPLGVGGIEAVAERLRKSGRFDAVEVRKRYRSLTEAEQVAVIIVVQERPGVEKGGVMPGPLKRFGNTIMAVPTFDYVDGYGVTAGGRLSFVNVFGKEGHIVLPLTVGSTRQAAVEIDKTLRSGPVRRLVGGVAEASRENPAYDTRDLRTEVWVEGSRPLGSVVSVDARAGWTDVSFGDVRDQFPSYGARLVIDTRVNPAFPRNAIYASAAWDALTPESSSTINRYTLDGRAYVGLVGSSVLALRVRSETADGALPIYERRLLGGFTSLRGFKAGSFTGDNLATASIELRVPFHSPMRIGQTGITLFGDAGAAYDHGTRLRDAHVEYGVGGGWYLRVPLVQFEIDLAYGIDRGTRVHVAAGFKF